MSDKIEPGPSEHVAEEELPDGWSRVIFSDGVVWRKYTDNNTGRDYERHYYQVAKFPFVHGFFLSRVVFDDNDMPTDVVVNPHPFRSLAAAQAAVLIVGPQEDSHCID
jgi:hypothetical protein